MSRPADDARRALEDPPKVVRSTRYRDTRRMAHNLEACRGVRAQLAAARAVAETNPKRGKR